MLDRWTVRGGRVAMWSLGLVLAGCAGTGANGDRRDAGAQDPDAGRPARDAGGEVDAGAAPQTEAQLATFWDAHGGRGAFPPSYVDAVETLLRVEDDVVAGDFEAADGRLDAVFGKYPLSDPVWWSGVEQAGTNVGTPVAYYGLRMLREIVDVGLSAPAPTDRVLSLAVVLPQCAEGQRPVDAALTRGETVRLTIDPRLAADDHKVVRQSLRLFQHYVWAITRGALRLEPRFIEVAACAAVRFSGEPFAYAGITNANASIDEVDPDVARDVDMWWVLYPSNRPRDAVFDDVAFVTGGMGGRGRAPVFIIDDTWLTEIPPHLGTGDYTDVERRVYLPQWLQHEFFHHLYRTWPELGLEDRAHQWFDRSSWPEDFVGAWEPDYYAESLQKRLLGVEPTLAQALRVGSVDLTGLEASALLGDYERLPVENDWHRVEITSGDGRLRWNNAAGASWSLVLDAGVLRAGPDCPYGEQELGIEVVLDELGEPTGSVRALFFNGEAYVRR